VTDWRLYDSVYTERYMGTPATNPDGYRNSAPVTHAADLHGDLLICHGAMDNNVHTQNTLQFAGAAMVAGHDVQLMLFPRVRHGIRVSRLKLPFHRLKADFLQRHLIGGEASPECGPEASNPCRSRASGPTGGGYS
jgi:dipeptidyl-peptidase-4